MDSNKIPSEQKSTNDDKIKKILNRINHYNEIYKKEEKINNISEFISPYDQNINSIIGKKYFENIKNTIANSNAGIINTSCPPIGIPQLTQEFINPVTGMKECILPIKKKRLKNNIKKMSRNEKLNELIKNMKLSILKNEDTKKKFINMKNIYGNIKLIDYIALNNEEIKEKYHKYMYGKNIKYNVGDKNLTFEEIIDEKGPLTIDDSDIIYGGNINSEYDILMILYKKYILNEKIKIDYEYFLKIISKNVQQFNIIKNNSKIVYLYDNYNDFDKYIIASLLPYIELYVISLIYTELEKLNIYIENNNIFNTYAKNIDKLIDLIKKNINDFTQIEKNIFSTNYDTYRNIEFEINTKYNTSFNYIINNIKYAKDEGTIKKIINEYFNNIDEYILDNKLHLILDDIKEKKILMNKDLYLKLKEYDIFKEQISQNKYIIKINNYDAADIINSISNTHKKISNSQKKYINDNLEYIIKNIKLINNSDLLYDYFEDIFSMKKNIKKNPIKVKYNLYYKFMLIKNLYYENKNQNNLINDIKLFLNKKHAKNKFIYSEKIFNEKIGDIEKKIFKLSDDLNFIIKKYDLYGISIYNYIHENKNEVFNYIFGNKKLIKNILNGEKFINGIEYTNDKYINYDFINDNINKYIEIKKIYGGVVDDNIIKGLEELFNIVKKDYYSVRNNMNELFNIINELIEKYKDDNNLIKKIHIFIDNLYPEIMKIMEIMNVPDDINKIKKIKNLYDKNINKYQDIINEYEYAPNLPITDKNKYIKNIDELNNLIKFFDDVLLTNKYDINKMIDIYNSDLIDKKKLIKFIEKKMKKKHVIEIGKSYVEKIQKIKINKYYILIYKKNIKVALIYKKCVVFIYNFEKKKLYYNDEKYFHINLDFGDIIGCDIFKKIKTIQDKNVQKKYSIFNKKKESQNYIYYNKNKENILMINKNNKKIYSKYYKQKKLLEYRILKFCEIFTKLNKYNTNFIDIKLCIDKNDEFMYNLIYNLYIESLKQKKEIKKIIPISCPQNDDKLATMSITNEDGSQKCIKPILFGKFYCDKKNTELINIGNMGICINKNDNKLNEISLIRRSIGDDKLNNLLHKFSELELNSHEIKIIKDLISLNDIDEMQKKMNNLIKTSDKLSPLLKEITNKDISIIPYINYLLYDKYIKINPNYTYNDVFYFFK